MFSTMIPVRTVGKHIHTGIQNVLEKGRSLVARANLCGTESGGAVNDDGR